MTPRSQLAALERHLAGLVRQDGKGRMMLGYSGGVDSAFLAVVAHGVLGDGLLAVLARSASYPEAQWRVASDIQQRFGFPMREITTHELDDPNYRANPTNRCYFCKSELWRRMTVLGMELGFAVLIDGTNADDLGEHRPGHRAAGKWRVHSPLAELSWTKTMIREQARVLGIPIWDAPAAPCLASRIKYGVTVTSGRLSQVERGEAFLRALGIAGDLRVRHLGNDARIEVSPRELSDVRRQWSTIEPAFQNLGFRHVELDPHGYRRGSLLALASAPASR